MEARSLKVTRWMTHLMLAGASLATLGVAWELKTAIEARGSLEETQFEARSQLEAIRAKNPFKSIHRSLEKVQTDEAHDKLNKADRKMRDLEKQLGIKRGDELEKVFVQHRNFVQEATAYSRPDELLTTLTDKTAQLEGLGKSRKWKNIERLAARMSSRVGQLRSSGKVESPLVRFMESDIKALNHLVTTSSLDDGDKNEVLRQLEGIRQEVAMLMDLHQSRRNLQSELQAADAAVGRWSARADLAIGTLKHRAQERVQLAVTYLWSLGAALILMWAVIAVMWSVARRSQRREQDQRIIDMLTMGVLADKPVINNLVGPARVDEAQRTLRVIRKRLNLGEDFQQGMPFGSILLDVEGRLVWGNTLFCEQFGIEEQDLVEENIQWVDVATRLAGPENDPVQLALEVMEPGTWQVQLQMEDGISVPLEMHITPIETKGTRKVLVVFYPLALMKETIQSQARIVMEPVRLALEALEAEAWGAEAEDRLAPLWKQAGLSQDWEKLSRAIHRMDQSRNELLLQVRQLETGGHDQLKTIVDLSEGLDKRSRSLKEQMQGLKDIRDSLVSIDQLSADFAMEHAALLTSARTQLKKQDALLDMTRGLQDRLMQAKDSVAQLEKGKQDYRLGKTEIQEAKTLLVQLHNRFLGTLPELDDRSSEIAAEMKDALINLDRASSNLETRLASLDVQITKLSMNYAGPAPELERVVSVIDVAAHERVSREIREAMQEDQELIIQRLKKVVDDLRADAQNFTNMREELASMELPVQTGAHESL